MLEAKTVNIGKATYLIKLGGDNRMPVVRVDMWKGRTEEEKEKLIKGITKVFVEIGMKAEWVTVILNEVPKGNWGIGGKQASKMEY